MSSIVRHRLLLYCECPETGGVTGIIENLVPVARKTGETIVVHRNSTTLYTWSQRLRSLGVPGVPAALPDNVITGWFDIPGLIRLARLFRTASLLHCHLHTPFSCMPAILLARLAGVPSIITTEHYITQLRHLRHRRLVFPLSAVREAKIFLLMILKRWSFRHVDQIITVSRENRSFLISMFGGRLDLKTQTIVNGIDTAKFDGAGRSREEMPAGVHITAASTPIVAVVAGLNNQKGHQYLLRAIPSIVRHYPRILFLFVGDGHLRDRLEALAHELGIAQQVEFAGMRHDIPSILRCSDLFVLPSLFEGMPLSILEAMAAGKAVVATGVDGTTEVVVDGQTGYLVPPCNSDELARRIVDLLSDGGKRARFGEEGKRRVAALFTAQKMAQSYASLYQKALLRGIPGI